MDLHCQKDSFLKGGRKCLVNNLNCATFSWKTSQSQEKFLLEMQFSYSANRTFITTIVHWEVNLPSPEPQALSLLP